jgi:fermentation-respiration switch protein FrsA (DUF1100 family)
MVKAAKKKSKTKLMIIIAIILVVLMVGYSGISFYIANILTSSKPNLTDNSSTFVGPDAKESTFQTVDGVTLHGWLYKNETSNANKRIIIEVAGFTQNRANDDYYGLFIAHDLYQHGYSILLFDPRESEKSSTRIDFGQNRGNDVLAAVQFAKKNGFDSHDIGIIADSLGSVATLMVIEKLQDIGPVVIDSGIARMQPLLELRLNKDYHIPSLLYPGIFFIAKTVYHQDIGAINPIDHVALVPDRQFLFLVGAKDNYVPPQNSTELLKAANPQSKLVAFPLAGHAHTYRSDPNLYLKIVYKFFDQQFADR